MRCATEIDKRRTGTAVVREKTNLQLSPLSIHPCALSSTAPAHLAVTGVLNRVRWVYRLHCRDGDSRLTRRRSGRRRGRSRVRGARLRHASSERAVLLGGCAGQESPGHDGTRQAQEPSNHGHAKGRARRDVEQEFVLV